MSEPLTDAEIDEMEAGLSCEPNWNWVCRLIAQARDANRLRAEVAAAESRGYDQGVRAGHEQAAALRRLRLP